MLKDDSGATAADKQKTRQELEKAMLPFGNNPAYIGMQELAAKGEQQQRDSGNGARAGESS